MPWMGGALGWAWPSWEEDGVAEASALRHSLTSELPGARWRRRLSLESGDRDGLLLAAPLSAGAQGKGRAGGSPRQTQ